jgi:hypothetical protein
MQIEIMHLKAIEDFVNNLAMFFKSAALDENVVKINSNFVLSDEIGND